jgi:hypothetical protein
VKPLHSLSFYSREFKIKCSVHKGNYSRIFNLDKIFTPIGHAMRIGLEFLYMDLRNSVSGPTIAWQFIICPTCEWKIIFPLFLL